MAKKTKASWVDIMALFVACTSVFFSYCTFDASREQFEKQTAMDTELEISKSKPLLNIELNKVDESETYGFLLKNIGNGTAIVESFYFYPDAQSLESNEKPRTQWLDENNYLWFSTQLNYSANNLSQGYAIPSNERGDMYLLSTKALTKNKIDNGYTSREHRESFYRSKDAEALENAIIIIRYRSLSSLDCNIYTLTFSSAFDKNNMRESACE